MPAIDDAVRAMEIIHDKHKNKFINLFTGKAGKFWTEDNTMQKELFPTVNHRNYLVFVCHDDRPVQVGAFQTREAARDYREKMLGAKPVDLTNGKAEVAYVMGRSATGTRVKKSYLLAKAGSERARELSAQLPKVATKRREPKRKTHQLDMFR